MITYQPNDLVYYTSCRSYGIGKIVVRATAFADVRYWTHFPDVDKMIAIRTDKLEYASNIQDILT